jgi:RsiW-degrading membrane proteinase PrsW (M82 family)
MVVAFSTVILIYTAAALLPAVVLMIYVYRLDRVEKEPSSLLWKLVLGGVLAGLCSILLEFIFKPNFSGNPSGTGPILMDALLTGVIEEGMKFYFLKKFSWKHPAFNYRFDGLVYAVFVSLGFAAFENILYIFVYGGLSLAISRGLLSIPGHMSFAVFMGIYYGRAKVCETAGDNSGTSWNLLAAVLTAVAFHFVYDATLMIQSTFSITLFVLVVAFIYIYVFWRMRKEASTDEIV